MAHEEKREVTPKQRVLLRFPEAHAYHWTGSWCIYPGDTEIKRGRRKPWVLNNSIGIGGKTASQAWAAAAKGLRRYPWK